MKQKGTVAGTDVKNGLTCILTSKYLGLTTRFDCSNCKLSSVQLNENCSDRPNKREAPLFRRHIARTQ